MPDTLPRRFDWPSMGTRWQVTIWDDCAEGDLEKLRAEIIRRSNEFDHLYSRFIKTSLVWTLTTQQGIIEVPIDLIAMLRLYETLYDLSGGKVNPLIGFSLSDAGYDADYSLTPKESIRPVPPLHDALRIINDTHIELKESVLIDLGALGKGYFVDRIADFLDANGIKRYLVNGSGDIRYRGNGESLLAGLEHPGDTSKVIGVIEMTDGALCASASNRRKWGTYHHTLDPHTLTSPQDIIATWVIAKEAAVADGLATCLFMTEPERYETQWPFDYCILNSDYRVKRSAGFDAELF